MNLSDEDLDLVNAYHDGELDPRISSVMRDRLRIEPDLRDALRGIEELSVSLKALRPMNSSSEKSGIFSSRPWRLVFAASVVLAFGLGASILHITPNRPETLMDWHRQFLEQSYDKDGILTASPAAQWLGRGPDLSTARLELVDFDRDGHEAVFLHYSGVNGCRLTFGTHRATPEVVSPGPEYLTAQWSSDGFHYSVVAVGMDRQRFGAVVAMLRNQARGESLDSGQLAQVREATRDAAPCA